MAARFWVGGTGTWDSTTTANWSATSGGAGGASVPGAADDVTINTASITVTTNYNVSVISVTINASAATLSLGGTLTCSGATTLTQGTFTTNNFNVTATSLSSSNSNTRTINLGSSTVTLSTANNSIQFTTQTNLTFNSGTSSIVLTNNSGGITVGTGVTFYDVSWTATAISAPFIQGANTFNNLSVAGRTSVGIANLRIDADQTINGTLTLSAGTNATMRTFLRSDTIGTTRTLTCAAFSGTDADFRDITIAGAAAPVSGTRLGDCKGNSGITFDAAKTVYWSSNSGGNWGSSGWSNVTTIGSGSPIYFPLAQDTATLSSSPLSGVTLTINAAYNIGTIDMSARTSNTMTLTMGSTTPTIYGNWINGTGTTITPSSGILTFAGRGSQTITGAGVNLSIAVTVDSPGGSVTLQDALTVNRSSNSAFTLTRGTFDANNYNFSLTGSLSGFNSNNSNIRTIAVGSGTWIITGTGGWTVGAGTNVTVTGSGTISLTSASAKTFSGGSIQTYPTINQGGTGTLTITGSNKFADITNTAIGRVQFSGGTTNEFTAFNLNGVSGNLLQVGSTNTTQVTLKAPSWNVGANSTDAGNNTGLSFIAGTVDYLSISYVIGVITAAPPTSTVYYGATNVTVLYYGGTPVSAVYYGAVKVF